MRPLISVIIVNYNSAHRLQKCLNHLKEQSFRDFEVLVIDNASEDGSAHNLDVGALKIHIEYSDNNLGFAEGNNKMVRAATGEWLAFLNPDAYAAPNWLEEFKTALVKYPDIEAFGSTQIDALNKRKLDGAGDVYHILGIAYRGCFGWGIQDLPPEGEVFAACGAAAFYEAQIFRELGGFEERFFCYGEDVDLGYRLRLMGGRTVQLAHAIVYHEGSAITGRHSDFTIYHGHRNRIWLAYKNTPFWLYWPFLPLHILANLYLLFRAPQAGITRPYFKGLWHGYKGMWKFKADRQRIQKTRKVSYKSLRKAIEWSPRKVTKRSGRNWPYKPT